MLQLPFEQMLMALGAVLAGLTIHELAHAYVALLLGDDTAARMGRVTLNPIRHIDPWGFVLLLVAGFGWARPVLIDRSRLRNPRRDDTLIALAGPAVNLLAAFLAVVLLRVLEDPAQPAIGTALSVFAWINAGLGIFNLLPIPPLDGSHVVLNLLPPSAEHLAQGFFRYGTFALLGIILIETVTPVRLLPIGALVRWVLGLFRDVADLL